MPDGHNCSQCKHRKVTSTLNLCKSSGRWLGVKCIDGWSRVQWGEDYELEKGLRASFSLLKHRAVQLCEQLSASYSCEKSPVPKKLWAYFMASSCAGATAPCVGACASLNQWLCCICKVTPLPQIGSELPSKSESCGGRQGELVAQMQ